jgi:SAM-dependent methyltransferase
VRNRESETCRGICPVCGSLETPTFFEVSNVPVQCNVLWPTPEEARQAPRADISLAFCQDCGHIFNAAFRPDLMAYGPSYENSLRFSPRFQDYAEALVAHLIERYDLHGRDVVEIGCGDGHFLGLLCKRSGGYGLGFDPGHDPARVNQATMDRVTFIRDVYSAQALERSPALVCCRHLLEHVDRPRDLLNEVRSSIRDERSSVVFCEVPNALFTLRHLAIWDIIYEHYSYFTPNSLCCLFHSCAYDVRDTRERYGGQFLTVEALAQEPPADRHRCLGSDPQGLAGLVHSFADNYRRIVASWRQRLGQMAQAGKRIVLWGAGSKGVMFLNTVTVEGQIRYVVDVNPRKEGTYIAGTGQRIAPPGFLQDYDPDVVLVMNRLYEREIRRELELLNVIVDLVVV